ncbi:MAG TPA: SprT family zinc-dependent metalloprotease [Candidatus Andersenbacteria bacterium]|nr:SprT family zinc-dependent metalloprotease [Candidatus Andersenbacteria bacterium]
MKAQQHFIVRRSRRARNLLLHVDVTGAVEVVVPWRASYKEAEQFVHEKSAWLTRALKEAEQKRREQPQRRLVSGEVLPLLGDDYTLRVIVDPQRVRSSSGEADYELSIFVSEKRKVRAAVTAWYKKRARQYFAQQVRVFTEQLGVQAGALAVSSARSQWGSCIPQTGRISLNWRLLLAHEAVARYVVAHEVAHLQERRHTPTFWRIVAQLSPDYAQRRRWLRSRSHTLQL